jgi:hypothetical protein
VHPDVNLSAHPAPHVHLTFDRGMNYFEVPPISG